MKQIDLWGNEVDISSIPTTRTGRYKTMQELHGVLEGKTCKECNYCVGYTYGKRRWYKCTKWVVSNSKATDIRLKNKACKQFEEAQANE